MMSLTGFFVFTIGWTALVVAVVTVSVRLALRERAAAARLPIADPGPLDDAGLRRALADSRLGPASPLRDRVQDAFERLLREKRR